MGTITTTFESGRDLTVHRVEGTVVAVEVINRIEAYYRGDTITANTLWDFSGADMGLVRNDEVRGVARVVGKYADARKGGRTALVLPGDLEFGLGRMFSSLSAIEEVPLEFGCFRNIEKAEAWLDGE